MRVRGWVSASSSCPPQGRAVDRVGRRRKGYDHNRTLFGLPAVFGTRPLADRAALILPCETKDLPMAITLRLSRPRGTRSPSRDDDVGTDPPHDGLRSCGCPVRERATLDAAKFEIVVKGRLSPTLAAAIKGFDVSHCDHGLTHLVGWISDQARLHGTLELLRDLNIELVSVNPVVPPDLVPGESISATTDGETDG